MAEPVTKRLAVTFADGLPLGTHATFKHDGQTWIAYPAPKNAAIVAVIDRILGLLSKITADALRSINGHPGNAELAAFASRVLSAAQRADTSYEELAKDKVKAVTS